MDRVELMKKLSEAINSEIANSDNINDVITEAKANGMDIFLVLEVTVGISPNQNAQPAPVSDAEFLKKMKITMD